LDYVLAKLAGLVIGLVNEKMFCQVTLKAAFGNLDDTSSLFFFFGPMMHEKYFDKPQ
jgi:hypothetical protein